MYSISTDNPETARALMAVRCALDEKLDVCDWPSWLAAALPGLVESLAALVAQQEQDCEAIARVYGVAAGSNQNELPWRREPGRAAGSAAE